VLRVEAVLVVDEQEEQEEPYETGHA
jgi:hypothetical protein